MNAQEIQKDEVIGRRPHPEAQRRAVVVAHNPPGPRGSGWLTTAPELMQAASGHLRVNEGEKAVMASSILPFAPYPHSDAQSLKQTRLLCLHPQGAAADL